MTYRSFKAFINKNTQQHNKDIFDLLSFDIKSKIILIVGTRASNVASYLSSIISACEMDYSHYINTDKIALDKRFLKSNAIINQDILCENAEKILKATSKSISNDDLLFLLSFSVCDSEYLLVEASEEYYAQIKDKISPFALILAINDDQKVEYLIENTKDGIKEIISLSQKDNFDYISNKYNKNGARITFASKNKITVSNVSLLGTSFYHYSYLYHISALDLNNIQLAHLAIESASVLFGTPRPYIYKGLENARPIFEFELYSLSPTVLLWKSEDEYTIHHKIKEKIDQIKKHL